MLFLVNPPRGGKSSRRKKARPSKGKAKKTRPSKGVTMAKPKRKAAARKTVRRRKAAPARKTATRKRRVTRRKSKSQTLRRVTARRVYVGNPRRRRRMRRNAGFTASGMVGRLIGAAKTAAFVVGGKAVTNYVAGMIPGLDTSAATRAVKKAGVGLLIHAVASRFLGRNNADAMLVGAILSPIEEALSNVPVLGDALQSGGGGSMGSYYGRYALGAYYTPPFALPAAMAPSGAPAGMGDWQSYAR